MKILVFVGAILLLGCFAWCLVAPYLSATEAISVIVELSGYFFCMIAVVFGCAFCVMGSPRTGHAQRLWFGVSACAFIFIVLTWSHLSDVEFAYWKKKWISNVGWQQMESDLTTLGQKALKKGQDDILTSQDIVPGGLSKLGLAKENPHGYVHMGDPETGYSNIVVYLLYGNRSRTWGLFVGPEGYITSSWPQRSYIRVGQNAYFVIGVND